MNPHMRIDLARAIRQDMLAQARHEQLIREARAGQLQDVVRQSRLHERRLGLARIFGKRPTRAAVGLS